MKFMDTEILKKLKQAERRLESLSREAQSLESEKQGYLKEIMSGGQLFREVEKADQVIKRKRLAISRAKEKVSNLRAQLQGQLGGFRRQLIEEKQRELNQCMEQRARYLKRIEELEIEISRYSYLVTGKKDRILAGVKDPLPPEVRHKDDFVSVDEAIGHLKLDVYKITCMNSEALLKEYLARKKKGDKAKPSA